ncbi:MAG: carboxypeptidase-like regulatory domain-containing protein [Planctomycetota bacterium]
MRTWARWLIVGSFGIAVLWLIVTMMGSDLGPQEPGGVVDVSSSKAEAAKANDDLGEKAIREERTTPTLSDSETREVAGETAALSGLVRDEDGDPVTDARVEVFRGEFSVAAVKSDNEGAFRFELSSELSYRLVASREGYRSAELDGVKPPRSDIRLVLFHRARLSGRVVDAQSGAPIGGASLVYDLVREEGKIYWPGADPGPTEVSSVADGAFVFESVTSGRRRLTTRHPDYQDLIQDIDLAPGERREGWTIELVPGAPIRGRIVEASGLPVAGAKVGAHVGEFATGITAFVENFAAGERAKSDENGFFELTGLAPGEYRLSVEMPGYRFEVFGPYRLLEVGLDVELTIERGIAIHGQVFRLDGELFPGAMITGLHDKDQTTVTGAADDEGHYEIGGLTPGQYVFFWGDPEGDPSQALANTLTVDIASSPDRQEVDLRFASQGNVTLWGRVLGPEGPLTEGSLQLLSNRRGVSPLGSAMMRPIDDEGFYRFEGVAGGGAFVLVLMRQVGIDSGAPIVFELELPGTGEHRHDIRLPEAMVTGRFVGLEIESGSIELGLARENPDRPLSGILSPSAKTDLTPMGTFELGPVREGVYAIFAKVETSGGVRYWIREQVRAPSDLGEIRLGSDATRLLLLIKDEQDQPLAGAIASFVLESGEYFPREAAKTAGPDGRISIEGLPAGRFVLVVSAPGRATRRIPLALGTGESIEQEVRLQQARRLEVTVLAGGRPVSGASVDVLSAEGRELPRPFHMLNYEKAWSGSDGLTDESGLIVLDDFEPGTYRLRVRASTEKTVAVTVDAAPVTRVSVDLD